MRPDAEQMLSAINDIMQRRLPQVPAVGEPGTSFVWERHETTRDSFLRSRQHAGDRALREISGLLNGDYEPVPGFGSTREMDAVIRLRSTLAQIHIGASAPARPARSDAFIQAVNPPLRVVDHLDPNTLFEGFAADAHTVLLPGVYTAELAESFEPVRLVVIPSETWGTASAAFALDAYFQEQLAVVTETVLAPGWAPYLVETLETRLAVVEMQHPQPPSEPLIETQAPRSELTTNQIERLREVLSLRAAHLGSPTPAVNAEVPRDVPVPSQ